MKRPLEAMPDLMAQSPVDLGIVRTCRFASVDPADRTDQAVAAVKLKRGSLLALLYGGIANRLNFLVGDLFPIHISFSMAKARHG